jgi:hypothetical protein
LRGDVIAVSLTALWLILWRTVLSVSWGFAGTKAQDGMIDSGILYNPGDTWSYLSWVQQYSHGANFAGLIYTTEPHSNSLWIFPLWLIGKIAALTGQPALGVYNTAGVFGAMAAVFLFRRTANTLRMPASARDWATVALILGSGGSWLWHFAHKLGFTSPANGGDLYFFDLFPSTTFIVYAYHACSLVLLIWLWWSATELENRLYSSTAFLPWVIATSASAVLLGFSRPYEPVAFLAAWSLKTGWHWLNRRHDPAAWHAALVVGVVLFLSLAPGIGYASWVARQPVWSVFANQSLTLGLPRLAWLWTLGGWGVLVGLGTGPALRADARRAVLPLSASLLLVVILLGLNGGNTKLASGLLLGPIFLAGWGATKLIAIANRLSVLAQIGFSAMALAALIGIPSLYLSFNVIALNAPVRIDADCVALAHKIPVEADRPPPTVLTNVETGSILPGLIGSRVWVGHWSLSPHFERKVAQLNLATCTDSTDQTSSAIALNGVLDDAHFDYALLQRQSSPVLTELSARGWTLLENTTRWSLLKAPQ